MAGMVAPGEGRYDDGSGIAMHEVCPEAWDSLLDCGADDYFSTAPAPGSYLATHWNSADSRWLIAGGAIAFLLFLPNLLWNIHYHFPFLELQENIRRDGRNVSLNPLLFFGEVGLAMLPASLPVWLAGYSGGRMAELDSIDYLFVVPSSSIHRIQEAQTTIYQVFWELTSTAVSKASGAGAAGSTQEVSHVSGHTG